MNWEKAAEWLDKAASGRLSEADRLERNFVGSVDSAEYHDMKRLAQRRLIAAEVAYLLAGAIRAASRVDT